MFELALAIAAIFAVVVALPIWGAAYLCSRRDRVLVYSRSFILAVALGLFLPSLLFGILNWAEYQAVMILKFSFCQEHHWVCVLADAIFGNAWWIVWLIGGLLSFFSMLAILSKHPNLLSRHAAL